MTEEKPWDIFISHASEDKQDFVRPLAQALSQLGLKVWYDEFALQVGDSLSRSIDKGMAGSKYGVVVISPAFMERQWPERELRGLVALDSAGSQNLILPIWHGVSFERVLQFSPTLADTIAMKTSDMSAEAIAIGLLKKVRPDLYQAHSRADLESRITSEQLRALSARLLLAREEDRRSIARDLHDDLAQSLAVLKIMLDGMLSKLRSQGSSDVESIQTSLREMVQIVEETSQQVWRINNRIRPLMLEHLGIIPAIKRSAEDFAARTQIICECDCTSRNPVLSSESSINIFRIFEEALTNVLRHAQATRIKISTTTSDSRFSLSIQDDGRGIRDEEKAHYRSLGLLGMRERAKIIGANLDISGVRGKGTTVTLHVPLSTGL